MLIPWKYFPSIGHQNTPLDIASRTGAAAVISEIDLAKNEVAIAILKLDHLG